MLPRVPSQLDRLFREWGSKDALAKTSRVPLSHGRLGPRRSGQKAREGRINNIQEPLIIWGKRAVESRKQKVRELGL